MVVGRVSADDRVAYWQRRARDAERRLRDRCVELYGLAARHGATDEELHHGWTGWKREAAS
jgi:hypothetical protein